MGRAGLGGLFREEDSGELVGAAGAGDAVGDVEFEDAIEI
jgi:hypothetical protein